MKSSKFLFLLLSLWLSLVVHAETLHFCPKPGDPVFIKEKTVLVFKKHSRTPRKIIAENRNIPAGEITFSLEAKSDKLKAGLLFQYGKKENHESYMGIRLIRKPGSDWQVIFYNKGVADTKSVVRHTNIPFDVTKIMCRIQSAWRCVRIKIWPATKPEPDNWLVTKTIRGNFASSPKENNRVAASVYRGEGSFWDISFQASENFLQEFNLLRNGSFEQTVSGQSDAADWLQCGTSSAHLKLGTKAFEGNRSILFDAKMPGANAWITQYAVPVRPGKKYQVSAWFKTALPSVPITGKMGAYLKVKGADGTIVEKWLSGQHDWEKMEKVFTPSQTTNSVLIIIGLKSLPGHFWVDDIVVKETQNYKRDN